MPTSHLAAGSQIYRGALNQDAPRGLRIIFVVELYRNELGAARINHIALTRVTGTNKSCSRPLKLNADDFFTSTFLEWFPMFFPRHFGLVLLPSGTPE